MNISPPLYPYLPEGQTITLVPENNPYIQKAKKFALTHSQDPEHPTGAIILLDGKIVGQGANGSNFHKQIGCPRKWVKAKTGTMYWLCKGCSPKNHAEQRAIKDSGKTHTSIIGADIYLWGHWWCCESCWTNMMKAGIKNVHLSEEAQHHFKKS